MAPKLKPEPLELDVTGYINDVTIRISLAWKRGYWRRKKKMLNNQLSPTWNVRPKVIVNPSETLDYLDEATIKFIHSFKGTSEVEKELRFDK